jgi:uncharacterized protein
MKMLIQVLAVALCLLGASAASASESIDAAKEAAINRLFDAMEFEKTMQQMMCCARSAIQSSALPDEKKSEALAKLEAEMPAMSSALMDQFVGKEFLDDVQKTTIQIYARHFTVEDLDQLSAFYRSPIGKKMLTKMPVIMQESMQVTMQQLQRRLPAIQEELMKRVQPAKPATNQ